MPTAIAKINQMVYFKEDKYIKRIIKKGFQEFFKYRVLPYDKTIETPIYFIGSIAHYFRDILEKIAKKMVEIKNIKNSTLGEIMIDLIKNAIKLSSSKSPRIEKKESADIVLNRPSQTKQINIITPKDV